MTDTENQISAPLSPEMRGRYEEDLERTKVHHEKMRQELANGLLEGRSILCVEQFGTKPGWPHYLKALEPERRKLLDEGLAGGPHTIHSEIVAHQFGFTRDEIGYNPDDNRPFVVWRASHGEEPPGRPLTDYAAVLMTGSDRMVTEVWNTADGDEAPWMKNVITLSRNLAKHNIPGLYVCFGHQIYAACWSENETMGPDAEAGRVEGAVDWIRNKEGIKEREFGPVTLYLTEEARQDPILQGLGANYFTIAASHSQHVPESRRPVQARVLAYNQEDSPTPGNPNAQSQMFAYEDGMRWTIQNHPELTGAVLDIVSDIRAEAIIAEKGDEGFRKIKQDIIDFDTSRPREVVMSNFLQIAGKMLRAEPIK